MIKSTFDNIKIAGISAAVSSNWTSLDDFNEEVGEKTISKFKKTTGVLGRYNAGFNQTTSDFCCAAAKKLLEEKEVAPEEIGAVVFVTQTSDYPLPATACQLHMRLGLPKDCIAFDVNLGCSGYVYGLNIIASIMNNSNINKALLLAGDTSCKEKRANIKSKTAHSATMLFGDSGTATLLVKDDNAPRMDMIMKTDGEGFKAIISPFGGWRHPYKFGAGSGMDDVAVFNFTISEVPQIISEHMEMTNTGVEGYDGLVLHQANLYILKQISKKTKFPMDKVLVSLDKYGNTSSSSVPITMVKHYGEQTDGATNVLMCGFGVGLSWGTVSTKVDKKDILPIIHTDEWFDDGYVDDIPQELLDTLD